MIKNKIINLEEPLSNENLLKLNMLLNTTLNGMSIEEINLGLIEMCIRDSLQPALRFQMEFRIIRRPLE